MKSELEKPRGGMRTLLVVCGVVFISWVLGLCVRWATEPALGSDEKPVLSKVVTCYAGESMVIRSVASRVNVKNAVTYWEEAVTGTPIMTSLPCMIEEE